MTDPRPPNASHFFLTVEDKSDLVCLEEASENFSIATHINILFCIHACHLIDLICASVKY